MKILAVDDDHAVRVSLNVMFRKWSDVVLEVAEEAQSAMEMLSKEEYLMMFCDVDMPGMHKHMPLKPLFVIIKCVQDLHVRWSYRGLL